MAEKAIIKQEDIGSPPSITTNKDTKKVEVKDEDEDDTMNLFDGLEQPKSSLDADHQTAHSNMRRRSSSYTLSGAPASKQMRRADSMSWVAALNVPTLQLHNLDNYTFSKRQVPEGAQETTKEPLSQEEDAVLQKRFGSEGMQRHVSAVLLTHQHSHPHILLTKSANGHRLPGGRLHPGEGDAEGLRRILTKEIHAQLPSNKARPMPVKWDVTDLLCEWYRPTFAPRIYPYLPVHITRPKESIRVFVVRLPEECAFFMPPHRELIAVPLFNVFNNLKSFGPLISCIPQLLSRFKFSTGGSNEGTGFANASVGNGVPSTTKNASIADVSRTSSVPSSGKLAPAAATAADAGVAESEAKQMDTVGTVVEQ